MLMPVPNSIEEVFKFDSEKELNEHLAKYDHVLLAVQTRTEYIVGRAHVRLIPEPAPSEYESESPAP